LPQFVLKALKQHHMRQMEARLRAGANWKDHGLVFCNTYGYYLDAGSLREQFMALLKKAGLPKQRLPRPMLDRVKTPLFNFQEGSASNLRAVSQVV
jgi:hypothetical protein